VNVVRRTLPNLEFSISYTTRQPRGREKDGCEYFFISREQFEGMIQKNEFLEHAKVFESDYYGTACRFLRHAEQNGNDLLLDIDVQGAEQVKTKIPDAVSVFIMPPNRAELERRLRERSQDSEPVIQKRLKAAGREIENYRKYDYILVNDRLEDSVSTLEAILLSERLKRNERADEKLSARAEKCRLDQIRERIQPILKSFGDTAASGQ
jgi:guanylate kinase